MTEEGWEIFSLVAECGSNSEAARILHISQSSVSRAITKLENKYNTKLLNRDTTPFSLTKSGAFLKDRIDRGMSISQQLTRFIQEQNSEQIRIGYAFPVSWHLIATYVLKIKQTNPGIRIIVYQEDKFRLRYLLSEGQLDLAVLPDKLCLSEYRIIETISDLDWGVAAPCGVPISDKKYVEPEDLTDLPLLIPVELTCADAIAEWYGDRSMIRNADTYNNMETMTGLINNGFGYGFVPKIEQSILNKHDISVHVCYPRIVTTVYVYTRVVNDGSDVLRRLLDPYRKIR